jgi:phosphohistidine phosphatase SixA
MISSRFSPLEGRQLFVLLRVAVALCFIGHGAFGIIGKAEWLPYFAIVGIGDTLAWRLMPVIGTVDILIGVLALARPMWAGFAWAAMWALMTAALRPLAGESVWEVLERAGNYGLPIAILAWAGRPLTLRAAFARMDPPVLDPIAGARLRQILIASTALLLVGHGALGLFVQKPLLAAHYATVGLDARAVPVIGALEIALAAAIIIVRPAPALLILAVAWKLASESLFPIAGAPIWEFIERGGSYVAPLAAAWLALASTSVRSFRRPPLPTTALGAASLLLVLGGATPASTDVPPPHAPYIAAQATTVPVRSAGQDTVLLSQLRAGGLVLVCRHAITDRSKPDQRNIDMADRSTQRNLSSAGEVQARELGEAMRRLGIPLGEVLASPFARTRESAELAFGRATVDDALAFTGADDEMRELLSRPPTEGRNRVLVSHAGRIFRILDHKQVGGLEEGDCAAIRPLGDDFELLGRIRASDWSGLR